MWDIQGVEVRERREDADAKVAVYIQRVTCGVSESFPTGENNLALLDVFRSHGYYQGGYQGIQGGGSGASGGGGKGSHQILKRSGGGGGYGRGASKRTGTGQGGRLSRQQRTAGRGRQLQPSHQKRQQRKIISDNTNDNDADSEDASADEDMSAQVQDQDASGQADSHQASQPRERSVRFADEVVQQSVGESEEMGREDRRLREAEDAQAMDLVLDITAGELETPPDGGQTEDGAVQAPSTDAAQVDPQAQAA